MSFPRYIEVVSSHRDRSQYPTVSDFIVPISGSSSCNVGIKSYIDPISLTSPIYIFQHGVLNHTGKINDNTYIHPTLDPTVPQPYVPGGSNALYRGYITQSAFRGYIFTDPDISLPFTPNGSNRLITDSTPLNGCSLTLDMPLDASAYAPGQNYGVYDFSGRITNDPSFFNPVPYPNALPIYDLRRLYCPQAFDIFGRPCPNLGRLFIGYYLCKEPKPFGLGGQLEARLIQDYYENKRQLLIESTFQYEPPLSGVTNFYSIRPSKPTTTINGNVINGQKQSINTRLEGQNLVSPNTILVTGATSLVNGQDPGYTGNYMYIPPQYSDIGVNVNYPNVEDANVIQNYYFYRIVGYPADNTFILDRNLDLTAFAGAPILGRPFEVLPVNQDNAVGIEYNGTIVSQNQAVCHEMTLVEITLPNVPLVAGSRIAFYPYIYVLLENATDPNGSIKSVIYSNNPPTNKALFIVPIVAIENPLFTPFIRLDGFSVTQTVKFKPNDALHFKVFLPDGQPFIPKTQDTLPPIPPDPLLQINAVFSARRI